MKLRLKRDGIVLENIMPSLFAYIFTVSGNFNIQKCKFSSPSGLR